jgi:long-chain acyl-CoA synthetase
VSGGAPLNPEIGLFFQAVGLTLLQGYGQTESGPIAASTAPARACAWTRSARRCHATEVKIAPMAKS